MWQSSITAYLHYLGFMLSFAALTVEVLNLKTDMTLNETKKVIFADLTYGLAAIAILVTGILRVLYFGKGTDYYFHNPFFNAKIVIFILVGLLSLYPTYTFLTWIKDFRNGKPPTLEVAKVNSLSWLIKGELVAFILLPLLAAIMARMNSWS